MRRILLLWAALAAAALPAFAHEDSVLDLEAMEQHVALRTAETAGTEPALFAAYDALQKRLARHSRHKLLRDLGKLTAAAEALAGPLGADATLRTLLSGDADDADAALAGEKTRAEKERMKIGRARHRLRVTAVIDAADALAAEARGLRDPADERPALATMKRAVRKYHAAVALGRRLRLSSAFPQFKAPPR